MAMKVIHDPRVMQGGADDLRRAGKRLAVVPTMGALHEGHLSLIREARKKADAVVTTIFVNPTQFGRGEDFERYPRDLETDAARAAMAGSDFVFAPDVEAMYGTGFQTSVTVEQVAAKLEGSSRPGHFRGVATVVTKLFHCTKPHIAVFGQKDAQQVVVIRRMIRDLNFDVELLVVPTVREADGLAMSSRNAYLTADQRREAATLYASLRRAEEMIRRGERSGPVLIEAVKNVMSAGSSAQIDYVAVTDADTLEELTVLKERAPVLVSLAAKFGSTRLIDNIQLMVEPLHG